MANLHQRVKFLADQSNRCRDMAVLEIFSIRLVAKFQIFT